MATTVKLPALISITPLSLDMKEINQFQTGRSL